MRVLLVEDEKNLSSAVCRLLSREHIVADPVYNGPDGLDCDLVEGPVALQVLEVRPAHAYREHDRLHAETRGCQSCFAARMSGPYDNNVVCEFIQHYVNL